MGEISSALEGVYGRYQATIRSIAGVYASEWEGDQGLERIRTEIASFAEEEGRRPRLMVVKMGQDGHDRGAKVIAPLRTRSAGRTDPHLSKPKHQSVA